MRYLLFSILLLSFVSCETTIQEPSLVNISHVNINTLNKNLVDVDADLIFLNPNNFELDVASADIKASIDNVEVAIIKQNYDLKMKANVNFEMPVNIKMDIKKLYDENPLAALGKGLQIMSDRSLDVKFSGSLKVGKGVAKISVPVEKELKVKF